MGQSHFNLLNKDTCDLFILCILCLCQLSLFVIYLLLLRYQSLSIHLFCSCSIFIYSLFDFCSLFIVQKKKIQFWSWNVFQVFDPAVPVKQGYHHHLCESINIIHQTAPTLSWYGSRGPITIIDIADRRNQYSPGSHSSIARDTSLAAYDLLR